MNEKIAEFSINANIRACGTVITTLIDGLPDGSSFSIRIDTNSDEPNEDWHLTILSPSGQPVGGIELTPAREDLTLFGSDAHTEEPFAQLKRLRLSMMASYDDFGSTVLEETEEEDWEPRPDLVKSATELISNRFRELGFIQ